MLIEIYIETSAGEYERLDMFEDEDINIQYKLKDMSDIGKVFSTYSQTFTVPASPKNNKILNYYFHTDIGGNKNRLINAKLYVNKKIYKTGKISINDGKRKLNSFSQYSINFLSGVSSLKDKIGEDTINDLGVYYPISWTADNFFFAMTTPAVDDYYVPLISNKRLLTYGSGSNDIKWINSTTTIPKAIDYSELRPAMQFKYVMDKIFDYYDLDVEAPLFARTEYTNLYIHLTKEKLEAETKTMDIQNAFGSYSDQLPISPPGYPPLPHSWNISASLSTEVFTITRTFNGSIEESQNGNFYLYMTPNVIFPIDEEVSVKIEYIDMRPLSPSFGQNIFEQTTGLNQGNQIVSILPLGKDYYNGIGPSSPLLFKINVTFNTLVSLTNVNYGIEIRRPFSVAKYKKYSNGNTLSSGNSIVNIFSLIPDMKIIDFLSSFFKMFNIRVRENGSSNKLYFDTPSDFYSNNEEDYTKYVDIEETSLQSKTIYKTYKFTHTNSKYRSNVDIAAALVNNTNSKAFGQLLYTNPNEYASGEYTIETKFSIVPPRIITNTLVQTQYGFDSSAPVDDAVYGPVSTGGKYKPNWGELTLLYKNEITSLIDSSFNPISFGFRVEDAGFPFLTREVTQYVKSGLSDFDIPELYTNSLGFKDEVNILPAQFIYNEYNLYKNGYETTIDKINTPNSFVYVFTGTFPPNKIIDFDMRNNIIIGEEKFRIEEATINILNGKFKLSLINIQNSSIV